MSLPHYITVDAGFCWRILVLENHLPQREDQIETLRHWDYQVFVVEAPPEIEDIYDALKSDAFQKARDYSCHIALIDLRLINDGDPKDINGIALVNELADAFPSLHFIIVSGYKMPPALSLDTGRWRYVGKEEGPEKLKNAIEDTIKQIQATLPMSGA
jgi:DNA-binding NarL/FixJ family response regulator